MKLPERLQRSLLRSPLPWLLLAVAWTWPAALHPVTAAPGSAVTATGYCTPRMRSEGPPDGQSSARNGVVDT